MDLIIGGMMYWKPGDRAFIKGCVNHPEANGLVIGVTSFPELNPVKKIDYVYIDHPRL
jgi:hypothetical protein